MKHLAHIIAIITAIASLPHGSVAAQDKTNIVFIFIDDLGWGDVGCYGNDFIDTPRIDQLAKEGIRFTDAYAAGAVCSPSRCAVQSGQNQARIGITAHIPGHWRPFERVITPQTTMALPQDTITVAESLKEAGYRTGYVGKWHLGRGDAFGPAKQGYDFAAEINGAHLPGKYRVTGRSDLKPEPDQFRTDFEADLCAKFISEESDKPFFLMLSPYAVHIPLAGKSKLVEKYKARAKARGRGLPHPVYAAMVEEVDALVGRVVDEIDAQGLTDNTMIVFTSDNGGLYRRYDYREAADNNVSSLAPLKGEKGSLHEGGIRVPLIVKYPNKALPGTTCAEPTLSYDFYPTFVAAASGSLPETQTIDGVSLLPLLGNPRAQLERDTIHWHYPHYHHDRPASAIRERDWKLIEYLDGSGDLELYHLAKDLGEQTNLAARRKGKAADLKKNLNAWRTEVIARMPIPNPSFDLDRAHEWWSMRTGKPVASDKRKRFPQTEKEL
ncbi:MAG: sulfatase-like hydrolase/transferase [Verrucomicrobiaceae bacterium]|nr:sulfatase-like hydrolase/transferase [Verrucomicrobiaceae bacterium]